MRTLALLSLATVVAAQTPADTVKLSTVVSGLKLRSIGPALTSGRIADIAVHPTDKSIWYVGTAAGGVWKTTNNGISFSPIFDGEGSFTIGAVAIDQKNPNIVWVGTGENNAQRVVAYGDGVYKSIDGFSDRLTVRCVADDSVRNAMVPSFIIQPLIENALEHGIARRPGPGRVEITARRDDGALVVTVEDDGPGITAMTGSQQGIGLSNTRARLEHLYGTAHAFALEPAPNGGARAVMRIPFRECVAS